MWLRTLVRGNWLCRMPRLVWWHAACATIVCVDRAAFAYTAALAIKAVHSLINCANTKVFRAWPSMFACVAMR